MTNSPYASGPADPGRAPQPAGPPPGPAAQPGRPAPLSFQYQPHNPYATFGTPTGPVLPPPPTFAERWGITASKERPRQVTWILQLLWIHLAATVVLLLMSLTTAIFAFAVFSFLLVGGLVFGLVVAAACLVLIWAVAKEELGRFGFQDPRKSIYIGLGVLGLNGLLGAFSILKVIPGAVQILTVLLILALLYTKPVRAWLNDRPGNWPRKIPDQHPNAQQQAPQQPVWRDVPPPAAPQPPAADGQGPAATGWPPRP
ncbi:hypothetical protein [Glycomyces harbinensis]|uniref:Uncharacterized protein n=1 Tax=Glycomyces harbinensis TaxID=58114 RepID=A0A1G6U2P6_9ACTN|nr:hypothetical protein [Glycomyces harbinensis]SDD35474.1 hypothetical protein SAMN05216270_103284 [Glycomyces harbinensis]